MQIIPDPLLRIVSRTSIAIHPSGLLILGTQKVAGGFPYIMALNMAGEPLWATALDDHPAAIVTMSPAIHKDHIYIGTSSAEEGLARNPTYQCCTFRASFSKVRSTGLSHRVVHTVIFRM